MVAEMTFQPHLPRALPRRAQFFRERGQQSIQSSGDIFNLSNGFWQGQPDGEMIGRARGADGFGFDPKGLIEPHHQVPAEPTRECCTG